MSEIPCEDKSENTVLNQSIKTIQEQYAENDTSTFKSNNETDQRISSFNSIKKNETKSWLLDYMKDHSLKSNLSHRSSQNRSNCIIIRVKSPATSQQSTRRLDLQSLLKDRYFKHMNKKSVLKL